MLFIDNRERKARQLDSIFDYGVGTNNNIRTSMGSRRSCTCLLRNRARPSEKSRPQRSLIEPIRCKHTFESGLPTAKKSSERTVMLFGKNLGRSHQGSLLPCGYGSEHRSKSDHRFTTTNIPLK